MLKQKTDEVFLLGLWNNAGCHNIKQLSLSLSLRITLSKRFRYFIFIQIKLFHYYSCKIFIIKFKSACNDIIISNI